MNDQIAIRLSKVFKKYKLYKDKKDRFLEAFSINNKVHHKDFYAIKNLDLEVKKGETIGIIGKNGSGKSTLLKLISGIIIPNSGQVFSRGMIIPLLELGSGFHPEFTGLENIYFYGLLLGFSRQKLSDRIDSIVEFADIGEYIDQPIKTYSNGMKMRLAFSVSVMVNPDILILDEVLSVGDEAFREKSYAKMKEIFNSGKTILFVSHSIKSINQLCTRAIMLDEGEKILEGKPEMVTHFYQNYWPLSAENKEKMKREILLKSH